MNCSLQENIQQSSDNIPDNSSFINTACQFASNKVQQPLWTRDRLECNKDNISKTSFYQKSNFLRGQETKKEKYSRLCKKNIHLKNVKSILTKCDTEKNNIFKSGVCKISDTKHNCNFPKNNLSKSTIQSINENDYTCVKYKKRVRHKQVCG